MAFLPYLFRRAIRHWQLFLTLGLGVVLATALLASGPLLVDSVTELGLRHRLLAADPLTANLSLRTHAASDETTIAFLGEQVHSRLRQDLGQYVDRTILSVNSFWMLPWADNQVVGDQRLALRLYEGIEDQIEFVEGTWPASNDLTEGVFAGVIGESLARDYDLHTGDRLPLSYKQESAEPERWLHVSGIARPLDPNDLYWFGESSPLRAQSDNRWSAQYSALVLPASYYPLARALFPQSESTIVWNVILAPEQITVDTIPDLRGRVATVRTELKNLDDRVLTETEIDDFLSGFAQHAQMVRAPLYILTAEIVLLALYYVTMVAALSVRQKEREFAILRSRGGSGWQIFRLQAAEAGLISVAAFLSGPGLGTLLVRGLATFGPLADVRVADWTTHLTRGAWTAAGVGAVACVSGLVLPLGPTLRRSIVAHQQNLMRPARAPWWQRFYLDVFLLVVGLVLLWRLHLYGGLVAGQGSAAKVDWLLLLSPLVLLLGAATILLRVFPLLLSLFAYMTARGRGLPGSLAMWQVSRNPAQVVLLVLLLTLAMALGILSTGLNATLDVSEGERAQYAVGADARLAADAISGLNENVSGQGSIETSRVLRGTGTVDLKTYRSFPRFEVLGIEPGSFDAVATFRSDFAEEPIDVLFDRLRAGEGSADALTIALPGRPARVGMWLWAAEDKRAPANYYRENNLLIGDNDLDRIHVLAKIQTAQGEVMTVKLEPSSASVRQHGGSGDDRRPKPHVGPVAAEAGWWGEWRFFSATLPSFAADAYPLSLHSFWIRNMARTETRFVPIYMSFFLDDIVVLDAETNRAMAVTGFETPLPIWQVTHPGSASAYSKRLPHSGEAGQQLSLNFDRPFSLVGFKIARGSDRTLLPALASPAFLAATDLQVGDTASAWISSLPAVDIQIIGTVQYFPTMYEDPSVERESLSGPYGTLNAGFLVVPRDPVLVRLNDSSYRAVNANEVWISSEQPISQERLGDMVAAVNQTWDIETVRKTIKADPMSLGLRGVTLFGYVLTSLLSIVGFATHFYMSARRREIVYGILRAMGLSPRQLYSSLILEQVILIVSGLALGTILGVLLNALVLPGLPITLGDRPPIPPFFPQADWAAVGRIYAILIGAFLVSLSLATLFLWRAQVHRVLRIGEE